MRITNCGRGIHKREVVGIELLRSGLPATFYAYTNLDLALGVGTAREIDVVLVTNRRIFVLDLKDWNGTITSADNRWFLRGKDMGSSPVAKVNEIARNLAILLKGELAKRPESRSVPIPRIEALVILTGTADRRGITETEIAKVLTVAEFLRAIKTDEDDRRIFGNVAQDLVDVPLSSKIWKGRLDLFFNASSTGALRPGRRRFHRYVPEELCSFEHPRRIYREYDAREDGSPPSHGTLRIWNFSEVEDVRFQTEEGRREIAGRERRIYHWLRDRSAATERCMLSPRVDDFEEGVDYWEIYDRRPRLKRLSEFAATERRNHGSDELVELARQLLSALAEFHRHSAAHLDIGAHSVWLEAPTTVRLSHLFVAKFPEVSSLGASRYQFLASTRVPEDVVGGDAGPFRRDVFLAATAIHQILFGSPPAGNPPEWDPSVDADRRFEALHDWFGEALDVDASQRFQNAERALEAFNRSTAVRPTVQEIAAGLDGFRKQIRSQTALVGTYPFDGPPLRESDAVDMWRSWRAGRPVAVKMWKQPAWGDLRKEGARLLAFLEHARDIGTGGVLDIPEVLEVHWLADAFAIVTGWIEGTSLDGILSTVPEDVPQAVERIDDARRLMIALATLHEAELAHGDIKPENVVRQSDGRMLFIDVLDFRPLADGAVQNTKYGGLEGDRFERDRRAVLRICVELLNGSVLSSEHLKLIAEGEVACTRDRNGRIPDLLAFGDALDRVRSDLAGNAEDPSTKTTSPLVIDAKGAATGRLEADEGRFYLRVDHGFGGRPRIILRGASEEIEFVLDERRRLVSASRRSIGQTAIGIVSKRELLNFERPLEVRSATHNDFSEMQEFLADPEVREVVSAALDRGSPARDEEVQSQTSDEEGEERLTEEDAAEIGEGRSPVDVPLLWKELIAREKDLVTEGVATVDSAFDKKLGAHRVGFAFENGTFEFNRNDTVGVQRASKGGAWRRLGEVDLANSQADSIVIEPSHRGGTGRSSLVEAGTRLRFVSHFETESLRRRSTAVDRILGGHGKAPELLSVFDPRSGILPTIVGGTPSASDLEPYGLNEDQVAAFQKIATTRPMGLLQGPPGTGKTRFIAALAHYAITMGLARNVLLSSQSHEAVNTAAEAVRVLFRKSGGDLDMVRIAMSEDQVSEAIRPFHAQRVEQSFKDRFRATFRERMVVAAESLGLGDDVADDAILFETVLRPVARSVLRDGVMQENDRGRGLRRTLEEVVERLGVSPQTCGRLIDEGEAELLHHVREQVYLRHSRETGAAADRLNRLFGVARLGSDFLGSASRAQRSFEPFIVGTRRLVAGTCVGLGRTSLGLTNTSFDLVIVDEAARCTASELLVPLQAGKWVVLVGDQAQLMPQHRPEVVDGVAGSTGISRAEIRRSDFERVFASDYGTRAGARLQTQYRMLPEIGRVVSEVFYGDLVLRPGRHEPVVPASALPPELSAPLVWVETDDLGVAAYEKQEKEGGSRTNRVEADLIVAMLERWKTHPGFEQWLVEQTEHPIAVGIICMYAAQRDLVYRKLLKSTLAEHLDRRIKVGTVDSYQGKENPIVIVSLVRNNSNGGWEDGGPTIREGFLGTPNRINVAVSRAMDRLILVGARTRWRRTGPMASLVAAFQRRQEEGSARTLVSSDVTVMQEAKPDKTAVRTRKARHV